MNGLSVLLINGRLLLLRKVTIDGLAQSIQQYWLRRFCRLAADKTHTKYGRIGFPGSYRQGFESNDFGGTGIGVTELVK